MDCKKILDNIDDFNLNDIEISNINITDIEKARVRKKVKVNIRNKDNNRKRKSIMIASMAVCIVTAWIMCSPTIAAIAADIPIIGDIYRKLGFFNGFEEYTSYIGETKEDNGYKFTIDNILGTPTDLLVGIKMESPVPFDRETGINKGENFMVNINMKDSDITATSHSQDIHYIDDNTVIINITMQALEGEFKSVGELEVSIIKTKYKEDNLTEEARADFNLKVDFKSSFRKVEKLNINEKINSDIKINSLETNIIKSTMVLESTLSEYEMFSNETPQYYLEVNGKIHREFEASGGDNITKIGFPTVNYEDIKNAESINIICITPGKIIVGDRMDSTFEYVNEGNIKYPKSIITVGGLTGGFYKIEKDENTLRCYFESEYDPIRIHNNIILDEINENGDYINRNLGVAYKNIEKENSYIIEYNDVNFENNIEVRFWDEGSNLDETKEVKTIKVK